MKRVWIFISKCAIVCGITFLLLLLLNSRYKEVMDNPYSDTDKFNYMDSSHNNIQICSVGSSHGEYAFYYEELSKQFGYECFNFAMASQTFEYDHAITSMYRDYFAPDCIMFIPISYFSFNNETTNEKEQQSLQTKYYTFLSPKYIPNYDPYVDMVTHHFPILSAEEDITKIFPKLSIKADAAESSGPSVEEFMTKAQNRYQRHMEGKDEYFMEERINNLYDLINLCKENNITPVLITTPYTSLYSDLVSAEFKEEFYQTINQIAQSTQTPYYNYSEDERFSQSLEYFSDADHLNSEGSYKFMHIIEEEIPEFQEFLSQNKPLGNPEPDWESPF